MQAPRTPSSSSAYFPHTSSPLSDSCFSPSPSTSAAAKLQSRRIAQYKSTAAKMAATTPTRRVSSAYRSRQGHAIGTGTAAPDESSFAVRLFSLVGGSAPAETENPRSALLRDRLRQRCAHRAQQARAKRVERERRRNALSSEGEDLSMESDEEEDEDIVINDELFRRIIMSARHKQRHSYRLSFQEEVGSSFDPDMDDIAHLERTLQEDGLSRPDESDLPPSEFDDEEIAELAAQAEEDELWAELDSAQMTFGFSDINDIDVKPQATPDEDVDMA